MVIKKEVLLVDGYNMIGSWPQLIALKKQDKMEDARDLLLRELSDYSKYKNIRTIVVFDSQFIPGIAQRYNYHSLEVIFTQEGQTADAYIEKNIDDYQNALTNVTVATSDFAQQRIVLGKGSSRKSAPELYKDIQASKKDIKQDYSNYDDRSVKRMSKLKDKDRLKLEDLYKKMTDHN